MSDAKKKAGEGGKKKQAGGRPTNFNQEIGDLICSRIMEGESVHKICKQEDMPARSTLNSWLSNSKNIQFSYQYAQALAFRTHLHAEQRHEIIDKAFNDIQTLPEGINANVWANLVKEQVRAIEWDAERMAAKRYKVKEDETTKGEAQPLNINFSVNDAVKDVKVTQGVKK